MTDIFLSYSRHDRATAERLTEVLEAHGWSVWWDLRIRSGQVFDKTIEQALEAARCVLVLWSAHARESDWVRAEAAYAKDHGKLLTATLTTEITPPLQFRHVHALELQPWCDTRDPAQLTPLLDDIATLLGPPGAAHQSSTQPPTPVPVTLANDPTVAVARETATRSSDSGPDGTYRERYPQRRRQLALLAASVLLASLLSRQQELGLLRLGEQGFVGQWLPALSSLLGALLAIPLGRTVSRKTSVALPLLALSLLLLPAAWLVAADPALRAVFSTVTGVLATLLLIAALRLACEACAGANCGLSVALLFSAMILGGILPAWWRLELSDGVLWPWMITATSGLLALLAWRTSWIKTVTEANARQQTQPPPLLGSGTRGFYLALSLVAMAVGVQHATHLTLLLPSGAGVSAMSTALALALLAQLFAALLAGRMIDLGRWCSTAAVAAALVGLPVWIALSDFAYPALAALALATAASGAWMVAAYQYACRHAQRASRIRALAGVVIATTLGRQVGYIAGPIALDESGRLGVALLIGLALAAVPLVYRLPLRRRAAF